MHSLEKEYLHRFFLNQQDTLKSQEKLTSTRELNFVEANMSRLFSLIQFIFGLDLRHWETDIK